MPRIRLSFGLSSLLASTFVAGCRGDDGTSGDTVADETSSSDDESSSSEESTDTDGGTDTDGDTDTDGPSPDDYGGNILMPELVTANGMTLTVQTGTHDFGDGVVVDTFGYNGNILGPTLEMTRGEHVTLQVVNALPELTTVHWHGMHVPAAMDGGPHSTIAAGETWDVEYDVLNEAATNWYHPHPHGETGQQVYHGLAGFLLIRDDAEAALELPRTYGVDDLPLALQDKQMLNGQLDYTGLADRMSVNGAFDAFREVPAQIVRLRFLDGSVERPYLLAFEDGRSFQYIASDSGMLEAPVELDRLFISPGERGEILVDFSADEGSSVTLRSLGSQIATQGIVGGSDGPGGGVLDGADFDVIRFDVVMATEDPVTSVPSSLIDRPPVWPEAMAAETRLITFDEPEPGTHQFNGQSYDMLRIDQTVQLGDIEIWELQNNSAVGHPFHIHDVFFYVLSRSGVADDGTATWASGRPTEVGPKDTIFVNSGETVRFITIFEDFTDPVVPYMYHCHMLTHEDDGMMAQFVVVP